MEGSVQHRLPQAAIRAAASAAEALQLCARIRAAAPDVPTCRRDCRTLARFAGKVQLVLEALQHAMMQQASVAAAAPAGGAEEPEEGMQSLASAGLAAAWSAALRSSPSDSPAASQRLRSAVLLDSPLPPDAAPGAVAVQAAPATLAAWAEAAADVREALAAAADLVAACGSMGRLQAVLESEEQRDRFAAAVLDLKLALSGLQAVQSVAPPDVVEDVAAVQRQLAALRFTSSGRHEQLTGQLVEAVVLLHTRQVEGPESVAPLLAEGLSLAGLPPATPSAWLDFEVQRLREGARKAAAAGDQVTAFFYRQVVMCLLAHVSACWDAPLPQPADGMGAADGAATLQAEGSGGSTDTGVATPSVEASTPQKVALDGQSDSGSLSLPPGEDATPQRGDSGDVSPAHSQQPPSSQAARFRQLMGAWSAGRTSSGSSPQQAPQPPAAAARAPSPLSEGALSSLLEAFRLEAADEDLLRSLEPDSTASLVAALQGPSELCRFVAATLLQRRLERGSEAERAELVALNIVPALLKAMQASRQPLLRAAIAGGIRHLARDGAMRQQLAGAGALPALSLLLQSSSGLARQAAARAISNLVVHSEPNKIEAARFGAIHSLARMLQAREAPAAQEAAAAALGNLAANSAEAQSLIASAGAIPLLVGVLAGGTDAAKQHAARAIRNLAGRDTQNKLAAVSAGGIPRLLEMLAGADGASDASRQAAASALSNIACNCEQAQRQMAAGGCLALLAEVLAPEGGASAACREACAWALSNLACCADVRAQLSQDRHAQAALIGGLVDLLRGPSDSGGQAAARAVKNLSAGHSSSTKDRIAAAGAIPLLVYLLSSPKDATRRAAASALWNLAYRNNANRAAIVRAGAIPPLVRLLEAPLNGEGCRQEAARALSNLSCNNDAGQGSQMVDCGAVPLLADMMRHSGPAGQEAAVGAISNLACIRAHQQEILDAGVAPLLLQLMQRGASPGCREAAARGFGNLVCDTLCDTLRPAAYQAVPLLVAVMRDGGSDGARQAAARAISNLVCSDATAQAMVAKSGAAAALVELCKSSGEELREAAAVALWDLGYNCSLGREAIARAGAVPWLAQLLLFGGAGSKEAAAACLAELAAVGPAVQQAIRDAGAVQLLEGLQTSAVPEVALAATEALRSLEANSRHSSALLGGGSDGGGGAAAEGSSSARSFLKCNSAGRRGSQTIALEQLPPDAAGAEVATPPPAAAPEAAPVPPVVLSPRPHGPPLPPGALAAVQQAQQQAQQQQQPQQLEVPSPFAAAPPPSNGGAL